MAEIRKHNLDDDDDLGRLVRDALGERIRPTEPGHTPPPAEEDETVHHEEDTAPTASTLSSWASDGPGFTF